jgi:hypothetical protein
MKTMHVLGPSETRSSFPATVGEVQEARRAQRNSPTAEAAAGKGCEEPPDPEVPETVPRRRFTAAFKLRVLQQADGCTQLHRSYAPLRLPPGPAPIAPLWGRDPKPRTGLPRYTSHPPDVLPSIAR